MRKLVTTIAEASVLAGAVLYGLGWVLFARFFGQFGATPEQVGIDFPFVVVRVGVALTAAMLVLGAVGVAVSRHERVRAIVDSHRIEVDQRAFEVFFLAGQALFVVIGLALIFVLRPWRLGDHWLVGLGATMACIAIVSAGLYFESAGVLRLVDYSAKRPRIRIGTTGLAVTAGIVTIALLIGLPFVVASVAADRVRSGHNIAILGVRVQAASVWDVVAGADRHKPLIDSECTFLLGEADGTLAFYDVDHSTLVLVGADQAVTEIHPGHGCDSGSGASEHGESDG
jgi:hypothetical protein